MRTFAVDDVDDACGRPEPEPTRPDHTKLEVPARPARTQEELLLVVLVVEDGSHDGGHEDAEDDGRLVGGVAGSD